jgi:hypothetical protein
MKKKADAVTVRKPLLVQNSGRIWFTAEAERRIYFFLTMAMLVAGVLYKIGVL